jgi:hypothetical protein
MAGRSWAYDDVERAVNASAEQAGVVGRGRERGRATTDAAENENENESVEEREHEEMRNASGGNCVAMRSGF